MNLNRKYVILLAVACAIIALDQATKLYIHTQFRLGESLTVIPDYFNITYVRNKGAAFGIFQDYSESFRRIFFLSTPPIAMVIILMILKGVEDRDNWQIFALSSVFGGAIGNYIDRIRYGFVVDFLDVHIQHQYTWPAFNVADSFIVIGVSILFLIIAQQWREERRMAQAKGSG